jgi:hypothetical protein
MCLYKLLPGDVQNKILGYIQKESDEIMRVNKLKKKLIVRYFHRALAAFSGRIFVPLTRVYLIRDELEHYRFYLDRYHVLRLDNYIDIRLRFTVGTALPIVCIAV